MSLPFISAICVTAGRVRHLNAAIACFAAQTHISKELIIVNTLPAQELVGDFPNVRIINLPERPKSLATARNIAIGYSRGDVLVTFDDDDGYGSEFLSTFATHFADGVEWVYQPLQLYVEGKQIKSVVKGSANVFAFTRKAFDALGGYPESLSVGEDKQFVGRITSQFNGINIPEKGFMPQFFYRWANGVEHISGLGNDKAGRKPAWERALIKLDQKIKAGTVKTGRIVLEPRIEHDYDKMGQDFLARSAKSPDSLGVVLTGKFGDIINCLPILKRLHDTGANPTVIVSKVFASIFEGTSYVRPYPVALQFHDLLPVMKLAGTMFTKVLRLQVYGKGHIQKRETSSYNKEPWAAAGMVDEFHNPALKPVFDRRNPAREAALANKLFRTTRPKIVTNLLFAASSPFPRGPQVLAAIKVAFKDSHEVLDISRLKVYRIYDLLGIIEKAELFVSIDTAALHLAAATDTPVVALVNEKEWLGTEVRFNAVAVIPYDKATAHCIADTLRAAISVNNQQTQ